MIFDIFFNKDKNEYKDKNDFERDVINELKFIAKELRSIAERRLEMEVKFKTHPEFINHSKINFNSEFEKGKTEGFFVIARYIELTYNPSDKCTCCERHDGIDAAIKIEMERLKKELTNEVD